LLCAAWEERQKASVGELAFLFTHLLSSAEADISATLASGVSAREQSATIDLPGPKGQRFDHRITDDEYQFLLSAHLGPGIQYVIA
jgi:hypothetical protein